MKTDTRERQVRIRELGEPRRRKAAEVESGFASQARSAPTTGTVGKPDSRGSRPRVIVADDEVDIANLVSYVLQDAGFEVTPVYSGSDALEAAMRECPDLVLLDVMMPGLDGREVSRRLKESARTSRIPVLLISAAYVDLATTTADAFLSKPFDLDVLVAQASRLTRSA